MRYTATIAVGLVMLVGFTQAGLAQQPPLDLSIVDLTYTCMPNDSAQIEALVQLATHDEYSTFVTDVEFRISDTSVGSVVYDAEGKLPDPCEILAPPCNTVGHTCTPIIINGEIVTPGCWELMMIDPPASVCVCVYLVFKGTITAVPTSPTMCTATVDPAYQITEWDEDNNSVTISVGPSPTNGTAWGMLKALYR
jgi:hypothetical protein